MPPTFLHFLCFCSGTDLRGGPEGLRALLNMFVRHLGFGPSTTNLLTGHEKCIGVAAHHQARAALAVTPCWWLLPGQGARQHRWVFLFSEGQQNGNMTTHARAYAKGGCTEPPCRTACEERKFVSLKKRFAFQDECEVLLVFERAFRGDAELDVKLAGVPDHAPRTLHSNMPNPYNIKVVLPSKTRSVYFPLLLFLGGEGKEHGLFVALSFPVPTSEMFILSVCSRIFERVVPKGLDHTLSVIRVSLYVCVCVCVCVQCGSNQDGGWNHIGSKMVSDDH